MGKKGKNKKSNIGNNKKPNIGNNKKPNIGNNKKPNIENNKKPNIENNKKSKEGIVSAIINAILVSVLTVALGFGVNAYTSHKEEVKGVRKNSAVLHSDMEHSLNEISALTSSIKKTKQPMVSKSPHSNNINMYQMYVSELKDYLDDKDYKNICIYYNNMQVLENVRKEYWERNPNIYSSYYELLQLIENGYKENKNGIADTLKNLEKLTNLEE